jgi:hypothetical protein
MAQSRGRSFRRHQRDRIKARVRAEEKAHYGARAQLTPRSVGLRARTRTLCSCGMCSPSRRVEGPRIQELRQMEPPMFDYATEDRVAD